jgi:hypothetical protein
MNMIETLYELSKSVALIVQDVVDAEGELSTELEKRLENTGLAFKDKAFNIGKWCLNIDGNVESIDRELVRLEHRKRTQQNLQKRLKDYLKYCMENAGLNKLDLQTFIISIAKNPPSVEIDDEEKLPAQYTTIIETKTIDKKKLLADIKDHEIPGAHLVTDKVHLRIK